MCFTIPLLLYPGPPRNVFCGDWKQSGKLQPSPPASLWTATFKVLGCSFNLKVQIKLTAKGILKSNSKDLQVGGKKLTFNVVGKSIKTKTGRFLTGKVTRQPFAKKVCVQKQFSGKFQSYLQVTVSGNIYGVKNGTILSRSSVSCLQSS